MLVDEIKKRITQAMKDKNVDKEILRVALGEIQTTEARNAKAGTDEEALAVVRKLVKSNEETLLATVDEEQKRILVREIEVLSSLLPTSLTQEQIVVALEPVSAAIKAAGNDGQATGIAMKHLKGEGAVVGGKDVTAAVKQIRG